jgi:hypothetical protein
MKGSGPQERNPVVERQGAHERIDPLGGIGRSGDLVLRTKDKEEALAGAGKTLALGKPVKAAASAVSLRPGAASASCREKVAFP